MAKVKATFDDDKLLETVSRMATLTRADKALKVIQSVLLTFAAEATPVGVGGSAAGMQGGWIPGARVISQTEVSVQAINVMPYAHYVIHGTDPAARNPGGFLVRWVSDKLTIPQQYRLARLGGMSAKAARAALERSSVKFQASSLAVSVAFMIGRARMRRGSPPNDFVQPIIDEHQDFWTDLLTDAIANDRVPS